MVRDQKYFDFYSRVHMYTNVYVREWESRLDWFLLNVRIPLTAPRVAPNSTNCPLPPSSHCLQPSPNLPLLTFPSGVSHPHSPPPHHVKTVAAHLLGYSPMSLNALLFHVSHPPRRCRRLTNHPPAPWQTFPFYLKEATRNTVSRWKWAKLEEKTE